MPYLAARGYRFQDGAQEMPLGVLGYRQYVTNLKLEFERHLYTGKGNHKSDLSPPTRDNRENRNCRGKRVSI